ncbi:AAA family ATPase [Corynebacterium sp. TA-R-1]|uniref:AAA family ATPase n=1 Tax=Corynebacterium stercoris TaxID=2943490 RepID=A0ABT1G7N7_9CORY|nr:ATP-binding protein [Corynebacterium stercoris]MCP1388712.1 AAA family ATPase [Corynebacterium stercoris]
MPQNAGPNPTRTIIERVRVRNFKRLDELTLELGNINVLVGPNNSGKSSFIQGLQFGISALQSIALIVDANGRKLSWKNDKIGSSLPANQLIYTPVVDPSTLGKFGKFSQSTGMATRFEGKGGVACDIEIRRGRNKNVTIDAKGEDLGREIQGLDSLFSILAPGLAGISATEEYRSPGLLRKAAARGDSNNYLRNFVYLLHSHSEEKWETFLERLDSIFPGIKVQVAFNPDHDEHIQCTVTFGDGNPISLDLAGTGVLQAVQILTYVGLYSPNLLMLDEPDSHLHPSNQRQLIQTLAKVAEEDQCKVILTTHSRHIVDEAESLDASLFWLSDGALRSADVSTVQNLMELGALDLSEIDDRRNVRGIILTEDSQGTDIMRCLAISNGWVDNTFSILTYDGSSNRNAVKVLVKYIRASEPDLPIVVYRDRDFDDEAVEDFLSLADEVEDVYVYIPEGPDSESLQLSDEFLQEFGKRFGLAFENLLEIREEVIAERKPAGVADLANCVANQGLFGVDMRKGTFNPSKVMDVAREKVDENPLRWIKGKPLLRGFDDRLRRINPEAVRDRLAGGYQSLTRAAFPKQRTV